LSKLLENAISPFQVLKDRVSLQSACEQLVRGSDGILTRAHIDFLAHGLKSGITGATIPLVRKEIQRILYSQIPDLQDENAIFLGTQKQVKDKLYVDPLPVIAKNAWDIIRKRDRATRFFRRDAAPIFVENGLPYEITPFHLQSICDETIKWIVRTGDSTLDLSRRNVPSDVPRHMAFSTAVQSLPLPRLERIVHAPYFGQQRTLHKDPGYSQEHATLYVQNGKPFTVPEIPLCPTEEHIKIAKSWISEVLIDFPFVGSRQGADVWMNPERTNAIALMIEPFIRSWFPKTPLYMIEAPTEGTGKGLLADACLFPALGKEPIKTTAPVREEEWEKRITALLSCLPSVIYFDNVITELHSQYLCKALTSNEDHGRKLQTSEMVTYPNRATWIATGNNPRLSREMIRRTIRIRLTAFCEKPSARNGFHHAPLLEWMSSHRPELVWSILVLIQNYISQGSPRPKTPITVGSFEEWAYCLQGILECNGIWGFYQNHDELEKANDGGSDSIKPLIETWLAMIEPISDESTRKIATPPMKSKELYFALTENGNEFPLDVDDNPVRRIGTILGKNVDRTFGIGEDLWQLQKIPVSRNLMAWSLVLLENVS